MAGRLMGDRRMIGSRRLTRGVVFPSDGPAGVFTEPSGPVVTYRLPPDEIAKRYGPPRGGQTMPVKEQNRPEPDVSQGQGAEANAGPYFYIGVGSRVRIAELVKRAPALLELLGDEAMIHFEAGAILVKGQA